MALVDTPTPPLTPTSPHEISSVISGPQKRSLTRINLYRCSHPVDNSNWTINWGEHVTTPEDVAALQHFQKIARFPGKQTILGFGGGLTCAVGMKEAAQKCPLGKQLNFMRRLFPKEYKFVPKTWILPRDREVAAHWLSRGKNRTLIVKPDAGCQGDGIRLIQRPRDVPFTSLHPLRAFIHQNGMVRIATEEYTAPDHSNLVWSCPNIAKQPFLSQVYCHLTNYSLNKLSEKFVTATEDDTDFATGHKRLLAPVLKQLEAEGNDLSHFWDDIKDLVAKTLIAMQPRLWDLYTSGAPADDTGSHCFQILGFDVLLDSKCKPWLLEVNNSPSLQTDAPIDEQLKRNVVYDTLRIVSIRKEEAALRSQIGEEKLTAESVTQCKKWREEFELRRAAEGGYMLVMPDAQFDDLQLFQNEKLLTYFRRACGVRGGMNGTKFARFCRYANLIRPGLLSAPDADLLYISVTRGGKMFEDLSGTQMKYNDFLDAFIALAVKLYPSDKERDACVRLIEQLGEDGAQTSE